MPLARVTCYIFLCLIARAFASRTATVSRGMRKRQDEKERGTKEGPPYYTDVRLMLGMAKTGGARDPHRVRARARENAEA